MQNIGKSAITVKTILWILSFGLVFDQVSAFLTNQVELSPGTFITGVQLKDYDAFYGVPFARPPVGNLRFRDPVPSPWWTGNYNALIPRFYCWQFDQQILPIPVSGTEDCLYMNIYRPRGASTKPLNVVVNIHGGGFYGGNTLPLLYGPDYFIETGQVILVSIAYRLNVFGFLATGDGAAPGNYGLKDQALALKWIQLHIGAFGGDPNSVTLFGQSAGSVSAHYHMFSPQSVGLFKNVMMISGTVEAPWGKPRENPREVVNRHARALGFRNAAKLDSYALIERLRKIPARFLTSKVRSLYRWDILPVATYLPVVEPPESPHPFLSVHPRIALANGDFIKVPVMTSIVHGDGINFVQPIVRSKGKYREFNDDMDRLMPVVLEMDADHPNMTNIVSRVRKRYFGSRGFVTPRHFDRVVRLGTEYHFERPLYTTCQAMAKHTPVFVHKFDYRGLASMSLYYTRSLRNFGVVHADDILYLFRAPVLFPYQLTEADKRVQQVFMKHMLSFIKFSDPGYPAWDLDAPKMTRFRRSGTADVIIDRVPVKAHGFWRGIQDLYEWPGRRGARSVNGSLLIMVE